MTLLTGRGMPTNHPKQDLLAQESENFFDILPIELFRLILQYLTLKELARFDSTLLNPNMRIGL
jgi:hypothetical protein